VHRNNNNNNNKAKLQLNVVGIKLVPLRLEDKLEVLVLNALKFDLLVEKFTW
jgi:hypothetical protein